MLRAGLTELFVTGMETKWINVNANPIGIPAKPTAAPLEVVPTGLMNQDGVSTDEARALYSGVRERLKANARVAPPHVITPPCLTPCTAAVPDQLWRHAPSAPRPTPGRLSLLRSSIAASTLPGRFAILSSQHGIKADHSSHFTLARACDAPHCVATSPAIPIAFDMNCPILSIMIRFI